MVPHLAVQERELTAAKRLEARGRGPWGPAWCSIPLTWGGCTWGVEKTAERQAPQRTSPLQPLRECVPQSCLKQQQFSGPEAGGWADRDRPTVSNTPSEDRLLATCFSVTSLSVTFGGQQGGVQGTGTGHDSLVVTKVGIVSCPELESAMGTMSVAALGTGPLPWDIAGL